MAQGPRLLGLPNKVLERICSQFCPHCAGEDCLGCSELPDSFWGPEYFGTLDALTQVKAIVCRAQAVRLHVFCGRRNSLPLLARTLAEHPALAIHVRVVRLGDRDKHSNSRCIVRELGSPEAVERLKTLVAPDLGAEFDLLCEEGEERLLRPFNQLPPTEGSFFCSPGPAGVMLSSPGGNMPTWVQADSEMAKKRIAIARLNAFILFKLAKEIKSVAILSEWPLALFPDPKTGIKIKVKQAIPVPDAGPLPEVEELRLNSVTKNSQDGTETCVVDIRKCVGLFSALSKLRSLEIRGGNYTLSSQQLRACRPVLGNLTTLKLVATNISTVDSIRLCCSPTNLQYFTFTIPPGQDIALSHGSDVQGSKIVDLLEHYNLDKGLKTLHLDMSNSNLFTLDPSSLRLHNSIKTVDALSNFTSLLHLTISSECIYYPSQYPRVLLRDANTGASEHDGRRLINFLPQGLHSVTITGIYAIPWIDVFNLSTKCHPESLFPHLKRVTLRGHQNVGDVTNPVSRTPYPVPEFSKARVDECEDWEDVEEYMQHRGPDINDMIVKQYALMGVEYEFDKPEYFFDRYAGQWDQDG